MTWWRSVLDARTAGELVGLPENPTPVGPFFRHCRACQVTWVGGQRCWCWCCGQVTGD